MTGRKGFKVASAAQLSGRGPWEQAEESDQDLSIQQVPTDEAEPAAIKRLWGENMVRYTPGSGIYFDRWSIPSTKRNTSASLDFPLDFAIRSSEGNLEALAQLLKGSSSVQIDGDASDKRQTLDDVDTLGSHLSEMSHCITDLTIDTAQNQTEVVPDEAPRPESLVYNSHFSYSPTNMNGSTIPSLDTSDKSYHTAKENNSTEDEDDLTPKAARPISHFFIGSHSRRRTKITMPLAQLDQLVSVFAKAPIVQNHVRKNWSDLFTAEGESIKATKVSDETANTYFSKHFMNPTRSAQKSAVRSFGEFILADPKEPGIPVRFVANDRHAQARTTQIGEDSLLSVPNGVDTERCLRIERSADECRVFLDIVVKVVGHKTGKKLLLLATEVDVTTQIRRAALAELATYYATPFTDIDVDTPHPLAEDSEGQVDWLAVADELVAEADLIDAVEIATMSFATLDADSCTMQTLTFLSALDRLTDQHQDFLVLRPMSFHPNGVPSRVRLPYVSLRLYHDWYERDDGRHGSSEVADQFRQRLVSEVAQHAADLQKFTTKVRWGRERQVVHCVPMTDDAPGLKGRSNAWVCFVRGHYDV